MTEAALWPDAAVFPARGLTDAEWAITPEARTIAASDGYPMAALRWPASEPAKGRVVVLHGVQSHAGWYHGLGRRLAAAGWDATFPDRRGSGANARDRGHAPSAWRLIEDVVDVLRAARDDGHPSTLPTALAGISWGGKLVLTTAARHPELVDAIAMLAPGLVPRVGVSWAERLGIAGALLTGRSKARRFPIPLADPALFTDDPEAQAFVAADPLSLREATAGLMASSFFLDRRVARAPARIRQPALLMLAGRDRIVDNAATRAIFDRVAGPDKAVIEYPEAGHTLDFEPDPSRYARDLVAWLDRVAAAR